MTKYVCNNCDSNIILTNKNDSRDYDPTKHYLLCKKCINKIINSAGLCSKSKCKQMFSFTDNDLLRTKYLFIRNPNNHHRYYLYSDIEKIIIHKYGNLESFKNAIEQKEHRIKIIKQQKAHKINKRRDKLVQALRDNKLEFNNIGDSFMYINYGEPSIEKIIKKEIKKTSRKLTRRQILAKALSKINIKLDESLESVYNFINGIGISGDIDETIKAIEMEYFYKEYLHKNNKTNRTNTINTSNTINDITLSFD